MLRIDLFPLRLARFVIAQLAYSIRPTGPRDRLLRRCRRNHVTPETVRKNTHRHVDERTLIQRDSR